MNILTQYPFPPIDPTTDCSPKWQPGTGFILNQEVMPYLVYTVSPSGWDYALTLMHEKLDDKDHYINRASRHYAIQAIKRRVPQPQESIIMEVGCSSGYFIEQATHDIHGLNIIGTDYTAENLEILSRKNTNSIPFIQHDITKSSLPSNSINFITMLNVLEHIEEDNKALTECHRLLKTGGYLYCEVPAGPNLYDAMDTHLKHFRRYRLKDLTAQMEKAGFNISHATHLGFILYPPFWLVKKINRLKQYIKKIPTELAFQKGLKVSKGKSPIMQWIMDLEQTWAKRYTFPIGIRCIVIAQKP